MNTDSQKRLTASWVSIITLSIIFLSISLVTSYSFSNIGQQFTNLGRSFIHGNLYLTDNFKDLTPIWSDTTWHNDHYYWPLGPLPAVILVPFIFIFDLLNITFSQGYIQIPLVAASFILCYWLARHFNYNIGYAI